MNKVKFVSLAASLLLAMAFIFSCSSDDGGDPPPPSEGEVSSSSDGSGGGGDGSSSSNGSGGGGGGSSSSNITPSSSSLNPTSGTFTDSRDGKSYKWVTIDTQTWMADNLNHEVEGSKCYDDDPANCVKYGRLYDWETAMTVCPSGWHLSSDAEWTILIDYVSSDVPTKLKATGGWSGGHNGTDQYGFYALPGGWYSDGSSLLAGFLGAGTQGAWWITKEYNNARAYHYYMEQSRISNVYSGKASQYSVRCLQGSGNVSSSSSNPPSSSSATPSSSSKQSKIYCDYGPVTEFGGGCFEIANESECDTQYGQVANSCPGDQSKLYCDYGPVTEFGGGCFEIEIESECDTQWGQVANSCAN